MSFLTGHIVVITKAPFGAASRSEAIRLIAEYGGRVEERVTKSTTLLFTDPFELERLRKGDKAMTSKSAGAVKHGVRVLTGDDFSAARSGKPIDQLGYVPPVAAKAVSKSAQKRQERAEAQSIARRIEGFFPPFQAGPYNAGF